jgi:hypothetical protein
MPGVLHSLAAGGHCSVTVCITGDASRGGAAMLPYCGRGVEVQRGRPDVHEAVRATVARARDELRAPPRRVAVVACGPGPLVDDARAAAAAFGCHFHAESFML